MRVLIAGGGTGGHIYPSLAIAEALRELDSTAVVEFVGTPTGLESQLVPRSGYKLHTISIGRLNRNVSLWERVLTVFQLPLAIWKGILILFRFRPDLVFGVGGYASAPLVLAASILRYRTFIWEPNAYPGLANRKLSRFVTGCLVVFDEAAHFMKNKNVIRVHMPVRKEIEEEFQAKKLTKGPSHKRSFHVLVFGGSQGARAINNAFSEAVVQGGDWLNEVEIVHQTGPLDFARIYETYAQYPEVQSRITAFEYLHDMPERYSWADLVICRAGTGTISELAACGKASLLIPLPSAADDHQTKNALALVRINGARLLEQKELTPERLVREIEELKAHPEVVAELEKNIRQFHKPRAAHEIANLLVGALK